ncbi:MAG: endonuclease/exonuclease/phosphatase family protein [Flavobacteriales bacterium]|nr:endonuclease/exonuclease/phosphatase family protein [Flavobacteriales bacterium]MCB9168658.1 endonuclease/exonuclease/phosphatase family protein [Flavobacteriales bacterium]
MNILFSAVLLLCYAAGVVSPRIFWPLALLGMAYPFVLMVHLGLLVWWAIFRPKRMLLSLAVILAGWSHLSDYFRPWGRTAPDQALAGPEFKVMSYNVRLFDLYNWSHNKHTRDGIFDLLALENADILCLQEFYSTDNTVAFNTKDTLLTHFRWTQLHDAYTQHTKRGQHFGIATLTTYPIIDRGNIEFPDDLNNLCIWSDVVIGADTLRVYNAHLASIRFGDEDYRFMEGLDTHTPNDSIRNGGARILKRLHDAFVRRAEETGMIAAHMHSSPHPVIYCGDLNDTPMSYSYDQLTTQLTDAFVESGRGVGHTYIGAFPSFRIDHILHGPELTSWGFRTLPDELSDHHPITCWMGRVQGP